MSGKPSIKTKDGRKAYLGRIRPKHIFDHPRFRVLITHDGRVKILPRLSAHYDRAKDVSPPPDSTNWRADAAAAIEQTYGNTQEGDCVIASKLHQIGVWTANESGTPALSSDSEALQQYAKICGAGDNGCVITDVLDYMSSTGLTCSGIEHKIDSYVALDWTDKQLVEVAIEVFGGGSCVGINLPQDWTCTDCVWDTTTSQVVGGHDVPLLDYDAQFVYVATWGGIARMTWAAFTSKTWIEEAYTELSPDWYTAENLAPNGINADTLRSDLALIQGGQIPPLSTDLRHHAGEILRGISQSPSAFCAALQDGLAALAAAASGNILATLLVAMLTDAVSGICPQNNTAGKPPRR